MISIVVPVYNGAKYLDRCVSSIISQVYQDWECFLIDDGSTDSSGAICDKWEQRDNRIKVIHQPNCGVSVARNRGLDLCSGDYVCFIDSDDWIDHLFLTEMINHSYDSDLVVSGLYRDYYDSEPEIVMPNSTEVFCLDCENSTKFYNLNKQNLLYAPHEKLYRAVIIRSHDLSFPEGCQYGEDLVFNYSYLEYVNQISVVAKPLYHYTIGTNSLSMTFRPNQFQEDYRQWKTIKCFHDMHGLLNKESRTYLYKRLWGIVYDGIFVYPKLDNASCLYLKRILEIPEINDLRYYQSIFSCSRWIKIAITHRCISVFLVYFMVVKFL